MPLTGRKKSKQYPEKICRCSNSASLGGVEWDRLIVHRTHMRSQPALSGAILSHRHMYTTTRSFHPLVFAYGINCRKTSSQPPPWQPLMWAYRGRLSTIKIEEEEVYLPRHMFVKARGHPSQTLQKYRITFASSHKAPEQIHKLLFRNSFLQRTVYPFLLSFSICICMYIVLPFYSIIEPC